MPVIEENQIAGNWFSKPGDSVRSHMQRQGISVEEVADKLEGGFHVLRGIFDGSIAIDEAMAKSLSAALGGTTSFWLKRQQKFESALDRAVQTAAFDETEQWLDLVPIPGPKVRGKITETKCKEEVKRRLIHFNVATFKAWQTNYGSLRLDTRFRTSETFESKDRSVLLWLRRGELEADLVSTSRWDTNRLLEQLEAIRRLTRVSHPARFLPKLRNLLAEAGVALAVVKTPKGCHASGASRLIAPDKAMILLSFRHRADDHFWFTLFHEIGHLVLHNADTFIDEEDTPETDAEQEANDFARRWIIPEHLEAKFSNLPDDRRAIMRFSLEAGVSPGLIVGQMQHQGLVGHHHHSSLKRRWRWEDINPAVV